MLVAPKPKEELIVYLSASHGAISAVLMSERDKVQMEVYFVSRALQGPKLNYTPMAKLVLTLVFAAERLSTLIIACRVAKRWIDVVLDVVPPLCQPPRSMWRHLPIEFPAPGEQCPAYVSRNGILQQHLFFNGLGIFRIAYLGGHPSISPVDPPTDTLDPSGLGGP
ncbi:reverse transcriptase domain-containing protein [Tanacetum coccineum]|uniref:Reverse transcriptase domain-containing protein n=1 Tax=Tanacetum coccineum TaxID=301880 RepID=A0ABQ5IA31_9ASTR